MPANIGIIHSGTFTITTLMCSRLSVCTHPSIHMYPSLQVSSNCINIKPILSCLQGMSSVPLAEELVHGQHPLPLAYLAQETVAEVRGATQTMLWSGAASCTIEKS